MTTRKLPWYAIAPYNGCGGPDAEKGNRMQWSVWDDDGNLVCECVGEDEGYAEAIAICWAVNRTGEKVCHNCDNRATCFGSYESETHPAFACDDCCGHGCEDGRCEPVERAEEPAPTGFVCGICSSSWRGRFTIQTNPAPVAPCEHLRTIDRGMGAERTTTCVDCGAALPVLVAGPAPVVRVQDISGDGTGPFKLLIGGHGVAQWPSKPANEDPQHYAAEVGRCVRQALADPMQPAAPAVGIPKPPWTIYCEAGEPVTVLPAGRIGEVFSVVGWSKVEATTLVAAANAAFYETMFRSLRAALRQPACRCYHCMDDPSKGLLNPVLTRMILCPTCGNKRCPHATDHLCACTGSNEPGQKGSLY